MAREIWDVLRLRRATLRDLDDIGVEVVTPPRTPLRMAFGDVEEDQGARRLHTLNDWRQQEPVERIVNTILLCAIRDGAQQITLEPQARGVHVRFTLTESNGSNRPRVRDHMKLPLLALEPVVKRVKTLACLDGRNRLEQWGSIHLRVDEKSYDLRVSTHPTQWGERVELRFSD